MADPEKKQELEQETGDQADAEATDQPSAGDKEGPGGPNPADNTEIDPEVEADTDDPAPDDDAGDSVPEGVTSTDLKADEAIDHIKKTPVEQLIGFFDDEDDRVTVERAWKEKVPQSESRIRILSPGHKYELLNFEEPMHTQPQQLLFIRKQKQPGNPELITIHNGTTNEAVLQMLIDRLEYLNDILPSDYNESAILHLKSALINLEQRTADRQERQVEGTREE